MTAERIHTCSKSKREKAEARIQSVYSQPFFRHYKNLQSDLMVLAQDLKKNICCCEKQAWFLSVNYLAANFSLHLQTFEKKDRIQILELLYNYYESELTEELEKVKKKLHKKIMREQVKQFLAEEKEDGAA